MWLNIENVIFHRHVGQSSAFTLSASPAGKTISILLPEGGHSKGKCLGNSFGTKGGAWVCALGFTPAAAMASHGSIVSLPTLRTLLCIPYTTVWSGARSAMAAPRDTGTSCWGKAGGGCSLLAVSSHGYSQWGNVALQAFIPFTAFELFCLLLDISWWLCCSWELMPWYRWSSKPGGWDICVLSSSQFHSSWWSVVCMLKC